MKELLHSIRNNQTQITDTKSLIIIWLEIRDDYRTLAELTEAEDDEAIDND